MTTRKSNLSDTGVELPPDVNEQIAEWCGRGQEALAAKYSSDLNACAEFEELLEERELSANPRQTLCRGKILSPQVVKCKWKHLEH
jgi:hypothetical protein